MTHSFVQDLFVLCLYLNAAYTLPHTATIHVANMDTTVSVATYDADRHRICSVRNFEAVRLNDQVAYINARLDAISDELEPHRLRLVVME